MLLLLALFTTGCALLLNCANLFCRDVKYIVQVVLNFGTFATPVFLEPPRSLRCRSSSSAFESFGTRRVVLQKWPRA
jgi:hypothetical protein